MREIDGISSLVIETAIDVHRRLGPGLLESVYETVMAAALARRGLKVATQVPVDFEFDGLRFANAYWIDILVEQCLILEIKSVETLHKAHGKQLLTYLRLANQPVGLLLNFAGATMKEGIRRVVNDYRPEQSPSASPRLRVNQISGEDRCSHSKE